MGSRYGCLPADLVKQTAADFTLNVAAFRAGTEEEAQTRDRMKADMEIAARNR